jgi:hypothetical protein
MACGESNHACYGLQQDRNRAIKSGSRPNSDPGPALISERAAECLIEVAADGIMSCPEAFDEVLEQFAAPIYATTSDGTLTHFNQACIRLAEGRPSSAPTSVHHLEDLHHRG